MSIPKGGRRRRTLSLSALWWSDDDKVSPAAGPGQVNRALDVFVNVMRDVNALKRFAKSGNMQRGVWDTQIARDIRFRMVGQDYVRVFQNVVQITANGRQMLNYQEDIA